MNLKFILIILATHIAISSSFSFTEQEQKMGLSFIRLSNARISYDSYTMLYHLDILNYKQLTLTVEKFLMETSALCTEIKSPICTSILKHCLKELDDMKRNELDIEAYQQKPSKTKRALEFVGNALHWAFGLMPASTAREYSRKIDALNDDSDRFHDILDEQTILIKEVIELNNKTVTDLQIQLGEIRESAHKYATDFLGLASKTATIADFTQGVQLANFIMIQHHKISRQILHCLEDVASGKITQLVPKERLSQDLLRVEELLIENQRLPIDFKSENPLHIFKYSQVSASLFGDRLLLEVTIPIVERESYTVYQIVPTPTKIDNFTIIINPVFQYFLLNNIAKEFIPITYKEYNRGQYNLNGEKILKPAENSRIEFKDNCELSIFFKPTKEVLANLCEVKSIPNANYFVPLNNNDLFYVLINKPIMVTEYCQGRTSKFIEMSKSGVLQLEKECRVVTDKVSLRPRNNYRFESKEILDLGIDTSNITFEGVFEKLNFNNISLPDSDDSILIQDYTVDFNNLIDKADRIIERNKVDKQLKALKFEGTQAVKNSYTLFGSVSVITILLIIAIVWYFYSRFFNIGTWVTLAKRLGNSNVSDIPRLFVQQVPNNLSNSGNLVQFEQPSDA